MQKTTPATGRTSLWARAALPLAAAFLAGLADGHAQGKIVAWSSLIAPDKITAVSDITGAEDFWTGHYAVALRKNGTLTSWGSSANPAHNKLPKSLAAVTAVSGGRNFCLALTADGKVTAWGDGDGKEAATVPPNLSGVRAISAGGYHALALRDDGTVAAWGRTDAGQCDVPAGLSGVVAVAAGNTMSGALKSDGTVICWGQGLNGTPIIAPSGLAGVTKLTAGDGSFLAVKSDGTGAAWGTNYAGQLPTLAFPGFPKWEEELSEKDARRLLKIGVAELSSGINESIALLRNGKILAANAYHPIPPRPAAKARVIGPQFYTIDRGGRLFAGGPNAKQLLLNGRKDAKIISAGYWHSVAAFKNDMVRVVGERRYLQDKPQRSAGRLRDVAKIVSGVNFDVALFKDGSVGSSGFNDEESSPPAGLSGVVDIDAGDSHAIALRSDGTVATWGKTDHIQWRLAVPEALRNPATSKIKAIAATSFYCLALQEGGKLFVWGGASWEAPLDVPNALPDNVVALAGGGRHVLGLTSDGNVFGYGDNGAGQTSIPAGLSSVKSIAAGGRNSLALKSDGTVVAWGAETTVPAGLANVTAISAGPYHCLALVGEPSSKHGN